MQQLGGRPQGECPLPLFSEHLVCQLTADFPNSAKHKLHNDTLNVHCEEKGDATTIFKFSLMTFSLPLKNVIYQVKNHSEYNSH